MGKRDIPTVVYFQDDARYADLLNGFIFDGEQVILETLEEIRERCGKKEEKSICVKD